VFEQHARGFHVAVVAGHHEPGVAFVVGEIRRQAGDGLIE
jgi:hypothetical protein